MLFLTIIQYFFHIYMLATFVQKPYHINDTARISCCFSIVTIHVFFTICFMKRHLHLEKKEKIINITVCMSNFQLKAEQMWLW
jgi:hypothetical protein